MNTNYSPTMRGEKNPVKDACLSPDRVACSARFHSMCRRSSGVERTLGKGEVDSSILSGGTISSPEN